MTNEYGCCLLREILTTMKNLGQNQSKILKQIDVLTERVNNIETVGLSVTTLEQRLGSGSGQGDCNENPSSGNERLDRLEEEGRDREDRILQLNTDLSQLTGNVASLSDQLKIVEGKMAEVQAQRIDVGFKSVRFSSPSMDSLGSSFGRFDTLSLESLSQHSQDITEHVTPVSRGKGDHLKTWVLAIIFMIKLLKASSIPIVQDDAREITPD